MLPKKRPSLFPLIPLAVVAIAFAFPGHLLSCPCPENLSDTLPPLGDSIKLPKTLRWLENNMVRVDSGSFMMGCDAKRDGNCVDNEMPVHKVEVRTFYLCRYEVRQIDWLVVMQSDPSFFQGCDLCPVENIRWDDVQEFIQKLNEATGRNFRLPTEAEWEFAARGGAKAQANPEKLTAYAGSNLLEGVGWYFKEGEQQRPHAVGLKQPNELGIYDMSGNVWEWCSDAFTYYKVKPDSTKLDPRDTFRSIRGGSWNSLEQDCRIAVRGKKLPSYRYNAIGLRLAHDWQPPPPDTLKGPMGKPQGEGKKQLDKEVPDEKKIEQEPAPTEKNVQNNGKNGHEEPNTREGKKKKGRKKNLKKD